MTFAAAFFSRSLPPKCDFCKLNSTQFNFISAHSTIKLLLLYNFLVFLSGNSSFVLVWDEFWRSFICCVNSRCSLQAQFAVKPNWNELCTNSCNFALHCKNASNDFWINSVCSADKATKLRKSRALRFAELKMRKFVACQRWALKVGQSHKKKSKGSLFGTKQEQQRGVPSKTEVWMRANVATIVVRSNRISVCQQRNERYFIVLLLRNLKALLRRNFRSLHTYLASKT